MQKDLGYIFLGKNEGKFSTLEIQLAGWPYIVLDWGWFGEIDLFSSEYTS